MNDHYCLDNEKILNTDYYSFLVNEEVVEKGKIVFLVNEKVLKMNY